VTQSSRPFGGPDRPASPPAGRFPFVATASPRSGCSSSSADASAPTRSPPDNVQTVGGLTPNVQDKDAGLVALTPGFTVTTYRVIAVDKFPVTDPAIKDDGDRRAISESSSCAWPTGRPPRNSGRAAMAARRASRIQRAARRPGRAAPAATSTARSPPGPSGMATRPASSC